MKTNIAFVILSHDIEVGLHQHFPQLSIYVRQTDKIKTVP